MSVRRLVLGAALTVCLLLFAVGAVAWFGSGQALYPPWHEHRTPEEGLRSLSPDDDFFVWDGGYRDPETDLGLAYQTIEIPAIDGSTLRGWLVPVPGTAAGAKAGVVAVHGAGADRRDFLRHVPIFHRAGLPVVLFDCREHGISDGNGRGISLGLRESEDVSSAVAWARSGLGWERVAVIGTSQGGASVILAGAADPSIGVVIAESSFMSISEMVRDVPMPDTPEIPGWMADLIANTALVRIEGVQGLERPSPLEAVSDIAPRPLLLLHGSQDFMIPVRHSIRLYEAAGPTAELWILEGAGHSVLFNHDPEAYEERVVDFLRRHLLPAVGS